MERVLELDINTVEKVKDFTSCNMKYGNRVDVTSGIYRVDGKSILGMFSLDLSHSVAVTIFGETEEDIDALVEKYKDIGVFA